MFALAPLATDTAAGGRAGGDARAAAARDAGAVGPARRLA
jgi:hypothetical protein